MYIEIWKPVEKGQAGIAKLQQVKSNAKKAKKRRKDTTYMLVSL